MYGRKRLYWATSFVQRLRGLLGRSPEWLGEDGVLAIAPCHDVHTFGMRQSLDIAFLDAQGRVIASFVAVGPRRRIRCAGSVAVLERFSPGEQGNANLCCLSWARTSWFQPGEQVSLGERFASKKSA